VCNHWHIERKHEKKGKNIANDRHIETKDITNDKNTMGREMTFNLKQQ
jgi:hypothetical protein